MCLLELWTGVQVWTIDFHVPQLPIRPTGDYHYLKLNFCTGGRCEVPLPAGYIYIDQGTLSVDVNPPVGVMLCPGGCYQGLEMAVDLEMCGRNALDATPQDVKRQMEYLERTGYLRRVCACGHDCKGCSAHCGGLAGNMPVMWEVATPQT